tara:strand:+ start:102 stop:965 length:864 start_codon:yes stop_codon:yes gene_type:complete
MRPIVKYQGGKSKELPIIKQLLPKDFKAVIEPFCGGAAVSFDLGKPALLLDLNPALINMYKQVQDPIMFQEVFSHVCYLKTLDHDALEKEYYESRDYINGTPGIYENTRDPYKWAVSYITVRQLCFSGMERYNAKGEFNVPFGHYKKFSCNLNWEHMKFLKTCQIHEGDFHYLFNIAEKDDWIFIDPPYRARAGYTAGDGGQDLHERLVEHMKSTNAKWLFVHSEDDFYKHELKDYHIIYKDFGYSQRWGKGKNHANAQVKHMYVTNYENDMTLHHVSNSNLLDICA